MEELKEKCRKLREACFEGEVTMTKATLWMIAAICLLAGIIHGLRMAPMTHGVMIGCGNGNGSGSGNGLNTGGCSYKATAGPAPGSRDRGKKDRDADAEEPVRRERRRDRNENHIERRLRKGVRKRHERI